MSCLESECQSVSFPGLLQASLRGTISESARTDLCQKLARVMLNFIYHQR